MTNLVTEEELAVMSDSAVLTRQAFLAEEYGRTEAMVADAAACGDLPCLEEAVWLRDIMKRAYEMVDDHISDVRIPDLLGESEAA